MRTAWQTMIRKVLVLIFGAILLAGCLSGPSEQATLQLTSSPPGAEIYLDNQYRGSTPATIADVAPGNHTLEFRKTGYRSWQGSVMIPPGTSNYFGALTALSGGAEEAGETVTTAVPVLVTLQISRDQIIVGDSIIFSGRAEGTTSVTLTLSGPGTYERGVVLQQVRPGTDGRWSYTWNPGTKIRSGSYTIMAETAGKTATAREVFSVIGDGVVTVSAGKPAIGQGETIVFSGRCTTNAPSVQLTLFGPERFSTGVSLGTITVNADKTWNYRYTTDLTMPTGVYTIYVRDVPQTTTGSAQFTIGFAN